jgi:N-acyl-D-amino-acid deacylase
MNDLPLRFFVTFLFLFAVASLAWGQGGSPSPAPFDIVIKGGMLYDGTGGRARLTDVAIRGDRIAGVGNFSPEQARTVIDDRKAKSARA